MTLDEIRAKYSTPGLRANELTRSGKRQHLESDPRTRDPKIVKDTLEELYGPDTTPALPNADTFDLNAAIDAALSKRLGPIAARTAVATAHSTSSGFTRTQALATPLTPQASAVQAPSGTARAIGFLVERNNTTKTYINGRGPLVRSGPVAAGDLVSVGPPPAPSGNVCADCGSANLIRAGTCETCRDCGWNPGCG
jgi:hypothetical protein